MLFLLLLSVALSNPTAGLKLSIAPEKTSYQIGESVNVSMKFENTGTVPLLLDTRSLLGPDEGLGNEIILLLTGPGEHPLPYLVLSEPSDLVPGEVEQLSPKQIKTESLLISNIFDLKESGTYLLQAIYNTTKIDSSVSFWHGRAVSPPVTFTVSEPKIKTGEVQDFIPIAGVDWMVDSRGHTSFGNSSSEAARLAVQTILDHKTDWPVTVPDQELAVALAEKQALSKVSDFSPDEKSRWEARIRFHEERLDGSRKLKLERNDWPVSIPASIPKIPADAALYTPPFLKSSDSNFVASVRSPDVSVSKVPVQIARALESGYVIEDLLFTDDNGKFRVSLGTPSSPILIAPLGAGAPFPHRIPILDSSETSKGAPIIATLPTVLEPQTEQIFSGSNLLVMGSKTKLTMNGSKAPILSISPSWMLAKIPSRLPGAQAIQITTDDGSFDASIPMVVIHGKFDKASLLRGEHGTLTLEEWGLPKAEAWAASRYPNLLFENGTQRTTLTLEEKTPMPVSVIGNSPGSYQVSFGIIDPNREQAITKLEALRGDLKNLVLADLMNEAEWFLELGEIGKVESLLEQLRYESFIQDNKPPNINEILFLIR